MEKHDLKKELKAYKARHHVIETVEIPAAQYLMLDGHGDPNTSQEFKDAITALYPVSYKLKFASKQELGKDFVVMPLEGLWWADDMTSYTTARDKSNWDWTLMIMQPDWITQEMFEAAVSKVAAKDHPVSLDKIRLESLDEGLCVQTLHIGTYEDETDIINQMHKHYIPDRGYKLAKKHHEIYLSDARKVEPSKLRTILRQPVAKA